MRIFQKYYTKLSWHSCPRALDSSFEREKEGGGEGMVLKNLWSQAVVLFIIKLELKNNIPGI